MEFQRDPGLIFPFSLGTCATITRHDLGEVCNLTQDPFFKNAPVKVTTVTSTSFTFTTLPGHFDPVGSTITFSTYVSGGNVYLRQTGW